MNRSIKTTVIAILALVSISGVYQISCEECQARINFYTVTGAPEWKDKRGWLENVKTCTWHGESCEDNRVTVISLNYNDLDGQLTSDLGNLVGIKDASLYYNNLHGSIPSEFGDLANLEVLILHNDQLTGPIPLSFRKLSSIKKIDLDGNDLSGYDLKIVGYE